MMKRRLGTRTLVLGAALAAAVGLLVRFTFAPGAEAGPRAFRWPAGLALTYDLTLSSNDTASFSQGEGLGGGAKAGTHAALTTRTTLGGKLRVRSFGERGGETALGLRLVEVKQASLLAADQEAVGDAERAALEKAEALVTVKRDGTVTGVQLAKETPEIVQNLLMLVVTESAVTLEGGPAWKVSEQTLRGLVESEYSLVKAGDVLAVDRRRARYVELAAARATGKPLGHEVEGAAHLSVADGVLERLESKESLHVGSTAEGTELRHEVRIELVLKTRGPMDDEPMPVASAKRRPGELAVSAGFEAKQLALRVDGLTRDELFDTLSRFANAGRVPDHNRFLWRATGLLRQRPELAAELVELYDSVELDVEGRALVLDLLVGAGGRESQAALREALGRRRAFGEKGYGMLYQRLGLVAHPDGETLDFARAHASAPGSEGKAAALASYGAVIGKRLRAGDARAEADEDALLAGLDSAKTPADQAMHLTAVSNLRLPSVEAKLASFATAESPVVRRAAARALHDQRGDLAKVTLVGLASDKDGEIQRQSLMGLAGRALETRDLGALTELVDRGGMNEIGYDALLDVVAPDLTRPEARAVVEAVLRQNIQNTKVLSRARRMLASAD